MFRTIREQDKLLEDLWQDLGDIPLCQATETIEEPFMHFPVGTGKEEIWHWFDERHSKGVAFLLGFSNPPIENLIRISTDYLPKQPADPAEKHLYWTDGKDILCAAEDGCRYLADFFKAVIAGADSGITVSCGQYEYSNDSPEDAAATRTGYHYLHFS